MIVFIEGPEQSGKNELYSQLAALLQNKKNSKPVIFYDTRDNSFNINRDVIISACAKVQMAMDIAYVEKDVSMIINNGPVSLIADSFKIDDIEMVKASSMLFSREHYQRVSIISVMSARANKDDVDMYRQITSRHMTIMSNASKENKYRMFIYKDDDAARKLFNNDIMALINN